MNQLTIRKLDHTGREVISYRGEVLERRENSIVLRTSWDRAPLDLGFVVLEPDDCWTETFYSDRWYNVFEMRNGEGRLKGWYCNITRPARIGPNDVAAEDLALDLWVGPDGAIEVLDEDEFEDLDLSTVERRRAIEALEHLKRRSNRGLPPFDRQVGDP